MYLAHYQLTCKPFQISSDPKFLWFGEKHKEAFAILKYGILDNKGFLLLTGDVGTGKTTLINALINSLESDVIVATVPDPNLTILDFLNYIADAFGSEKRFQSKGEFLHYFYSFLNTAYRNGKKVLLIIDEAQRMNHELLEEVRVLSNIEKQSTKLLNIFFVGQDELDGLLWEDRNRALRQRITISYHVDALNGEEIHSYIEHRLKISGTEKRIFSIEAVQEIMAYSGGFPRTVNIICDHALLTGYVKGRRIIDRKIIRECAQELRIPAYRFHLGKTPENNPDMQRRSSDILKRRSVDILKEKEGVAHTEHARDTTSQKRLIYGVLIGFLTFLLISTGYLYYKPFSLTENIREKWYQFIDFYNQGSLHRKKIDQSAVSDRRNEGPAMPETKKDDPLLEDDVFSANRTFTSESVGSQD